MGFKYWLINLGCRLNQAELAEMEVVFSHYGGVADDKNPDVVVVNTCGVTAKAEKESRQMLRRLRKQYPGAKLVAWGCAADKWLREDRKKVEKWGVDLVYGNENKDQHPVLFIKKLGLGWAKPNSHSRGVIYSSLESVEEKMGDNNQVKSGFYTQRPRRFIKIQTGCNKYCTFCLIPYMRHLSNSRSIEEVVELVKRAQKDGVKEVILTGVDIADYGRTTPAPLKGWRQYSVHKLTILLKAVLRETTIPRIRLGSINPVSFSDEFIDLFAGNNRLMPHFHISLQSGSDGVLKRMNRRYTKKEFYEIVKRLRERVGDVLISTDIIVGFPGETPEEFGETVEFVKEVRFSRLHVFSYSPRPGVVADKMGWGAVSTQIKKKRSQILRDLNQKLKEYWKKEYKGRKVRVLWERWKEGELIGWSHNYLPVRIKGERDKVGQVETITYPG